MASLVSRGTGMDVMGNEGGHACCNSTCRSLLGQSVEQSLALMWLGSCSHWARELNPKIEGSVLPHHSFACCPHGQAHALLLEPSLALIWFLLCKGCVWKSTITRAAPGKSGFLVVLPLENIWVKQAPPFIQPYL